MSRCASWSSPASASAGSRTSLSGPGSTRGWLSLSSDASQGASQVSISVTSDSSPEISICSLHQIPQQGEQAEDGRYLRGEPHLSHRRGHPLGGQTLRPGGAVPRRDDGSDPGEPL